MLRNPLYTGIITALLMMALLLGLEAGREKLSPAWQYAVYAVYGAGIVWTLWQFSRTDAFNGRFGSLFNQGFRCFIVVTLLMVVFTIVFLQLHPEYAEQEAAAVTEYYIKEGGKTPAEIADQARQAKKQYPVTVVSLSIFRYLITGALLTAAAALGFTRRKV